MLIEKCQNVSAAQGIRISFLSGDVHVCAAGRLYSDPKVNTTVQHAFSMRSQNQKDRRFCISAWLTYCFYSLHTEMQQTLSSSIKQHAAHAFKPVKVNNSIQTHSTSCHVTGAQVLQYGPLCIVSQEDNSKSPEILLSRLFMSLMFI